MTNHISERKPPAAERMIANSGGLADLTVEQLALIAKFVQQAGGIERAQQAIESLEQLKKAA
jgi:hypothetical protein